MKVPKMTTLLRSLTLLLSGTILATAIGCFTPTYTTSRDDVDSEANTEDVILLDRYVAPRILPDRISITRSEFSIDENGYPTMQLEMRSLRAGKKLKFDIRSAFKDANGATVDTTSWSPVVLAPGETYTYRGHGTDKSATDAQVQIRRMQ